jgi:Endonuclease NucS
MKEQFRNYLVERRYTQSTVNGYMTGLNYLSRDYGQNILEISDANLVSEIRKIYDLHGSKRSVGDYGKGSARNAIVQYHNFINELGGETRIQPVLIEEVEPSNRRFTYERDLHNTLEEQAAQLFPEYQLVGSEYSIGNARLDLLLEKNNQLLIVELKAGVANYEVFGQISMYLGLVKAEFTDREVHGLIVANEIHEGLKLACSTSSVITCKTYKMKILLEKA